MAKRLSAFAVARMLKHYKTGDRVRILRGTYAGQVLTVADSANDWVTLKEIMKKDPSRYVMSKRNIEPEKGFTQQELEQAERVARKAE